MNPQYSQRSSLASARSWAAMSLVVSPANHGHVIDRVRELSWHTLGATVVAVKAKLNHDMTLTRNNTGGRGRYRTADRWCVKGQDRVHRSPRCPARPGQRRFPCPIDADVSTACALVLGHWRVTGVFGRQSRQCGPSSWAQVDELVKVFVSAGRTKSWRERGVVPISREDRDFVQTLERGLAVLHAFDADHQTLTLRETAEAADLPAGGPEALADT